MPTAQINARIDAAAKASGDFALAEAGFTPTQAVRALWGLASRYTGDPAGLRKVFEQMGMLDEDDVHARERLRKVQLAKQGPSIFEDALAQLGVSVGSPLVQDDLDGLLDEAYDERLEERGLLA